MLSLPCLGQQPNADQTKRLVVERPAAKVVADASTVSKPAMPDGGKRVIEMPVKKAMASLAPGSAPLKSEVNPTVKPGEIRWHPSFAAAREAAKKSGKPVLLFHMMGQLDKQFC
jgi:hypothetical protein